MVDEEAAWAALPRLKTSRAAQSRPSVRANWLDTRDMNESMYELGVDGVERAGMVYFCRMAWVFAALSRAPAMPSAAARSNDCLASISCTSPILALAVA